jgi:hypothetical protein
MLDFYGFLKFKDLIFTYFVYTTTDFKIVRYVYKSIKLNVSNIETNRQS